MDDQKPGGGKELVWKSTPFKHLDKTGASVPTLSISGAPLYMPIKVGEFQQSTVGGKIRPADEQAKVFLGSSYLQSQVKEMWHKKEIVDAAVFIRAPGSHKKGTYRPMEEPAHMIVELLKTCNVDWKK